MDAAGAGSPVIPSSRQRLVTYGAGCLTFSLGAYLFIYSDLGTDPLDVFALGLLKHVRLTIGIAQAIIALLCILLWAAWYRRRPLLLPLLTFSLCGSLIDILRALTVGRFLPLPAFTIMLLATTLCAYASSLIIMSGVGIRAMDLLAIAITDKWQWPFWGAKMFLEGILLLTGYVLGGPVGIGTVCFLAIVDTLIQPFMWANMRVLKIRNLGMPSMKES